MSDGAKSLWFGDLLKLTKLQNSFPGVRGNFSKRQKSFSFSARGGEEGERGEEGWWAGEGGKVMLAEAQLSREFICSHGNLPEFQAEERGNFDQNKFHASAVLTAGSVNVRG